MSQIKLYPGVLTPLSIAWKFLPSDTYIHPHTMPSLVQTMACQHQISILSDAGLLPIEPLEHTSMKNESQLSLKKINLKQDRRWNADKPSAALDPYIPHMINHFVI